MWSNQVFLAFKEVQQLNTFFSEKEVLHDYFSSVS